MCLIQSLFLLKRSSELKATITQLELEKEELEHNLYHVSYEKNELKFNLNQKEKQLYKGEEKAEFERSKRQRTLGGLFGARFNLDSLYQQLDVAQKESRNWKSVWTQAMWEQEEVKGGLELKSQNSKRSIEESQVFASKERRLSLEAERLLPVN